VSPTPRAWALVSSTAGVLALVGGWTIAQAVQPSSYDPVTQTISALARHGLAHRWIMTSGLGLLGAAHITTAAGLRGVRPAARAVLALAGLTTIGVSIFAEPLHGSSSAHIALATIGFVLLAVWPATLIGRRSPAVVERVPLAVGAALGSTALLLWVAATLSGGPLGLAERLLTFEQALWPLIVVIALRRAAASSHPAGTIEP
jgi:hypothetical membrane protein